MSAITPTLTGISPDQGHHDLELGDAHNSRIGTDIFNPTTHHTGVTFDVFNEEVNVVLRELERFMEVNSVQDKMATELLNLQKELAAVKFRKPVISFQDLELHIVNYLNSADNGTLSIMRQKSLGGLIFSPQPAVDYGTEPSSASQSVSNIKAQILRLYTSPVNVKLGPSSVHKWAPPVTAAVRHLPMNLLLALLVVRWGFNSFEFLPGGSAIGTPSSQRLPPFSSDIELPSKRRTSNVSPVKSQQRIVWFRNAPSFLKLSYFQTLAKQDYYNHRPDTISVSIYLVSEEQQVWKALFLFSSAQSLEGFSARLDGDKTKPPMEEAQISTSVFMHLLLQILDNGASFLKEASKGIHLAKYKGINSPSRLEVEYLILLEDYLRELPSVLDKAIENIGQLSLNYTNTGIGWCDPVKEDIEYLKKRSGILEKEANSIKQTVINHIAIAETMQMAKLTILASVFIPLSFTASFFGMNLTPINSGPSNSSQFSLMLYWEVGLPLTFVTIVLPFVISPIVRFLVRIRFWTYAGQLFAFVVFVAGILFAVLLPHSVNNVNVSILSTLFIYSISAFYHEYKKGNRARAWRTLSKELFFEAIFLGIFLAACFAPVLAGDKWYPVSVFLNTFVLALMLAYNMSFITAIKKWRKKKKLA